MSHLHLPMDTQGQLARIELTELLGQFGRSYGRRLSPRGRRDLAELLELLEDYLRSHGVRYLGARTRGDTVSPAVALDWLDSFEAAEVEAAFSGQREQLRLADAALRALGRQLGALR